MRTTFTHYSLWIAAIMPLAACSARGDAPGAGGAARPAPVKDILQLDDLHAHPRACSDTRDCPVGSHCDDRGHTCAWDCYASSDCGAGNACTDDGRCVARSVARAESIARPPSSGAARAASAVGTTCVYDEECDSGAYCDAVHHVCARDCDAASGAGCSAGLTCDDRGRCVAPNATSNRAGLSAAPTALELLRASDNPALADRVKPVTFTLVTNDATVAARGAHVQLVATPGAEIVCDPSVTTAPTSGFVAQCSLQAWSFQKSDAGPAYQASATIWVRLADGVDPAAQSWSVAVRSNEVTASVASIALTLPERLRGGPGYDGDYTGTITLDRTYVGNPNAPTLSEIHVPIDATIRGKQLLIADDTRQVSPTGTLYYALDNPTNAYVERWLTRPDPKLGTAALSSRVYQDGAPLADAGGVLTGYLNVQLGMSGTRPIRLRFDIHRTSLVPTRTIAAPATGVDEGDTLTAARLARWTDEAGGRLAAFLGGMSSVRKIYDPSVYLPTRAATPLLDGLTVAPTSDFAQLGYGICARDWNPSIVGATISLVGRTVPPSGSPSCTNAAAAPAVSTCDAFYDVDASWWSTCAAPQHTDPHGLDALKRSYVPCLAASPDALVRVDATCANLHSVEYNQDTNPLSYSDFLAKACVPSRWDYAVQTADGTKREIEVYLCPDASRIAFGYSSRAAEVTACAPGAATSDPISSQPFGAAIVASSGDITCKDGSLLAEVPLLDAKRDTATVGGDPAQNEEAGAAYDACMRELAADPPAVTGNAAQDMSAVLAATGKCVNLGRFATSAETARRVHPAYYFDLLRRWVDLHAFVAQQGRVQWEASRVLARVETDHAAEANPQVLYDLLDRLDQGWDFLLSSTTSSTLASAPGALVSYPDYRAANGVTDPNLEHEQLAPLSVAIFDALTSYLKTLETLVGQLGDDAYATCAPGVKPSESILARVGTSLRYAAAVQQLAETLAGKNYNRNLTAKITRARQELRATWQRLLGESSDLARCKNPLGIAEDDLPLFFGDPQGSTNRYFASSDYLLSLASPAVSQAGTLLAAARDAWDKARVARIQAQATDLQLQQRVDDLREKYGAPIVAACGLKIDAHQVLSAFDPKTGTLKIETCHVDTSKPACTPSTQDPSCLSGQIGEAVLTIKAAQQDVADARKSWEDAQTSYDLQYKYCTSLEKDLQKQEALTQQHDQTLGALRQAKEVADIVGIAADAAAQCAGGAATSFGAVCGPAAIGAVAKSISTDLGRQIEDEEQSYQAEREKLADERDLAACFHEADLRHVGIGAAALQIERRGTDLQIAFLKLRNLRETVQQQLAEGNAAIQRELGRKLPSVAHHYWFEEAVVRYADEFEYAKRLTFLVIKAAEWESQMSFDLRGKVIAAANPDDLSDVVKALVQAQGTRTVQGLRPGPSVTVLSLRDELLGLTYDRTTGATLSTDDVNWRLRDRLLSAESAYYDQDGNYIGQAIAFTLSPDKISDLQFQYGERVWSVFGTLVGWNLSAAPQGHPLLLQRNTFYGKYLPGKGNPIFEIGRVRPSGFLFGIGNPVPNRPDDATLFTAAQLNLPLNLAKKDLSNGPYAADVNPLAAQALAGRGIGGDYVLLFPKQDPSDPKYVNLENLEDVLLRFDYYAVTPTPGQR